MVCKTGESGVSGKRVPSDAADARLGLAMQLFLGAAEAVFAEVWRILAEFGMSNCSRTGSG